MSKRSEVAMHQRNEVYFKTKDLAYYAVVSLQESHVC